MDITIHVDDDKLMAAIRAHLESLMHRPNYSGGNGGMVYEAARAAAEEAVRTIDFGPYIKHATDSMLHHVVAEVVTAELKRQATMQAKLMLAANKGGKE